MPKPKPTKKPKDTSKNRCGKSLHAALQGAVNKACKPDPGKCKITDNCPLLKEKHQKHKSCAAERRAINKRCFNGG